MADLSAGLQIGLLAGLAGGLLGGVFVLAIVLVMPARTCGQCGQPLPKFRKPNSLRQALWGGVTCPYCGPERSAEARPTLPTLAGPSRLDAAARFWVAFGGGTLLLAAACAGIAAFLAEHYEDQHMIQMGKSLKAQAAAVEDLVHGAPGASQDELRQRIVKMGEESGHRIRVIGDGGHVLVDTSNPNHGELGYVHSGRTFGPPFGAATIRVLRAHELVEAQVAQTKRTVWWTAALSFLAAIPVLFMLARWLSRRAVQP